MQLKQIQLPSWVGGLKYQFLQVQTYAGMASFIGVVTLVRNQYIGQFPWLSWPVVIAMFLGLVALGMAANYTFSSLSDISYSVHQAWKADNPTVKHWHYIEMILESKCTPEEIAKFKKKAGI